MICPPAHSPISRACNRIPICVSCSTASPTKPHLDKLLDEADEVFHLAAVVGVRLVLEEPQRTVATNIDPVEALLRHLSRRPKPLFLASTSEVYGKNPKTPLAEDDDLVFGPTTRGRWVYACSKAVDEYLALAQHQRTGSAGRHRSLFQRGRTAPGRSIRHGPAALRRSGAERRPAMRPRRRPTGPLLRARPRCGGGGTEADGVSVSPRCMSSILEAMCP